MIRNIKTNIKYKSKVTTKPDVSVAVCTFNRAEYLRVTLQKLIMQDCGDNFTYEVVVVDNASNDNTCEVVEEISKNTIIPVRYFKEMIPGLAHARNRGVKESQGDWIVCFDDDQLAEPNWLNELLKVAIEKKCHCVGGRRLLYLPEEEFSALGSKCREILGEHDRGNVIRKYTGSVRDLPCDANVLRSRTAHKAVSEFNSVWKHGGQDQDFSRRLTEKGFDMWYAPNAIVHHMIPPHRLNPQYCKWTSLRWGSQFAFRDTIRFGRGRTFLLCIARLLQMLIINYPSLVVSYIRGNKAEILDRKCLIVRAVGYLRQYLFLLFPIIFAQKKFFDLLDFREARIK
jgi:glycosyltransferase involved in cell wall biosynthesis